MALEHQRYPHLGRLTEVLDRYVLRTPGSARCGRWEAVHEQGIRPARKRYGYQGQNRPRKGPQLNWNRRTLPRPGSTSLQHHFDRNPGYR
jgi:hypothetical protein